MARQVAERSDTIPALANVFRTYGFDGASLAVITEHTGLGKGSLYNFFPRGKEEMAEAVLDEVDGWFRSEVFEPLRAESVSTEAAHPEHVSLPRATTFGQGNAFACSAHLHSVKSETASAPGSEHTSTNGQRLSRRHSSVPKIPSDSPKKPWPGSKGRS